MTALYPTPARRTSAASMNSLDDMITPCPSEEQETGRMRTEPLESSPRQGARAQAERPKSWRDDCGHFNPLDGDAGKSDPTELWRTMLAIERNFGCYNSARMRAAIEMGDEHVPVRKWYPSLCCVGRLVRACMLTEGLQHRRRVWTCSTTASHSSPRKPGGSWTTS